MQTEHHCGPAALAALLTWAGKPEPADVLAAVTYLPGRSGTLPIDLAREIRARGLLAYPVPPRFDRLLAEVAAGHPVLLLENRGLSWAPLWHYSVLAGYDLEEGLASLHAGGAEPETAKLTTLARTWARAGSVGLLGLPAGRLPAAEDPGGVLSALADLEDAGKAEAVEQGYRTFVKRWPEDWRGAFGWGNALHALGREDLAEQAFRRAHGTAPERPEPLNNLALLALGRGDRVEAAASARLALENASRLGLPLETYQDTLRSVDSR